MKTKKYNSTLLDWDEIRAILGEDGARRLADVFGGFWVYIPSSRRLQNEAVAKAVLELRAQGKKPYRIARLLGISIRKVYRILRTQKREEEK